MKTFTSGLVLFVAALAVLGIAVSTGGFAQAEEPVKMEIPVRGMVTMVDVGADKCIPCKLMAPVLSELSEKYAGKAAILFVDVWKDTSQGPRFGVRTIPTQIFYDREGKEYFRHEGYYNRASIMEMLKKAGVEPPEGA